MRLQHAVADTEGNRTTDSSIEQRQLAAKGHRTVLQLMRAALTHASVKMETWKSLWWLAVRCVCLTGSQAGDVHRRQQRECGLSVYLSVFCLFFTRQLHR